MSVGREAFEGISVQGNAFVLIGDCVPPQSVAIQRSQNRVDGARGATRCIEILDSQQPTAGIGASL